jgi:Tol biopolymer transport system component/DNA-binding winged helix-turn-helix (wHTH) protein
MASRLNLTFIRKALMLKSLCYDLNPGMATQPSPGSTVVFGPFEYDDRLGRLTKYGIRVRLQGKPLQVLSLLVHRSGEIITRDELQRHLWRGTTFVDFEQGLNSAVNKLRQTLGDSADHPCYVETLTGQGYRFIAPIERLHARPVLEIASAPALRLEPKPQRRIWLPFMAGVALTVVVGCGIWLGGKSKEPREALKPVRTEVTPPSGFALEGAGSRQGFALSPDGSQLAFTAMDSSGQFSVFARDLASLEASLVRGSEGAHSVFWPPDGRSLYLSAKGKLWRSSLQGDANVLISDSPPFLFSGVWLSPARILLDSFRASHFVAPSGGPLEQLKDIYLWPWQLPDGEHLLYVSWSARLGRFQARALRLRDFKSTDLIEADSRVLYSASIVSPGTGYLLYIRGGTLLAHPFDPRSLRLIGEAAPVAKEVYSFSQTGAADFSVSNSGAIAYQSVVSRTQLVWVDRDGRQIGAIGPANINVKSARISPDGKRLATAIFDVEHGQQDLWLIDAETNAARRFTGEPALRDAPVWSPDSATLAFLHTADATLPRVHLRGLGQHDPEEAAPEDGFQMPTDWSPDGRFLAFVNSAFARLANDQQGDVWLLDMARGRKRIPLLNTRFHESTPVFSPDGKWLAFTSNESGRAEVYVQAFRSGDAPDVFGERYLVSRAGAIALRWPRKSKELFYLGFDGQVYAVPVGLSAKPSFAPETPLFTISTEARAAIHSTAGFDVSADGQRFVIPVVSSAAAPSIVVVQNWEGLLPAQRRASR